MKICRKCLLPKDTDDFPANSSQKDGRHPWCKPCKQKADRDYRIANPERSRERHLLCKYKLSLADFDALLQSQGYACAICRRTSPGKLGWSVDHDHRCCPGGKSCGKCVRGLLCRRCNTCLGVVEGWAHNLTDAIESYLDGHKTYASVSP